MSNQIVRPKGTLEMTFRMTDTNEVVDHFIGKNIITADGMNQIFKSFTDVDHVNEVIETLSLGNDVGVGTVLNPTPPTELTSAADHDELYIVPVPEFFVSYPQPQTVRFFATINGATVMEQYPTEPNVVYTSAMLKTASGKAFCYRRFSGRTISALISVDISWTIEFSQE